MSRRKSETWVAVFTYPPPIRLSFTGSGLPATDIVSIGITTIGSWCFMFALEVVVTFSDTMFVSSFIADHWFSVIRPRQRHADVLVDETRGFAPPPMSTTTTLKSLSFIPPLPTRFNHYVRRLRNPRPSSCKQRLQASARGANPHQSSSFSVRLLASGVVSS